MAGWIKLHRSIKDWEWYGDINVRLVFIHCLLKANYEDKKWQGKLVKRGSFLTGRDVLADEIGISVRSIRTALTKLKSTSDLTIKTTSQGTLVTLMNYDKFQSLGDEATSGTTSGTTNERPANDQQTTTTKKLKKSKNQKKEEINLPFPSEKFSETWEQWVKHKKEVRSPATDQSVKMQLNKFKDFSEQECIEAIETAIAAGWKSAFPRKQQQPKQWRETNSQQFDPTKPRMS